MDIKLEVLIPLAVLLVILTAAVIFLVCRFFIWEHRYQKKKRYRKVSQGVGKKTGYPKMPPLRSVISTSPQQIETQDQLTPYTDIGRSGRSSRALYYTDINGRQYRYETLSNQGSDISNRSSNSSVISETDTGIHSDRADSEKSIRGTASVGHLSRKSYPYPRERFKSEPNISIHIPAKDLGVDSKRKRFASAADKRHKRTSTVTSIAHSAGGQIEFGLYYDNETRCLEITVSQLIDLNIKPASFLPLLEIHEEPQNTNKVHLVRDSQGQIEISDTSNMAFLVYVTLLPKRKFSRHTNVVFGSGNVVFNEKFSIKGYSTEQLAAFQLCFHALCKFGREGEPIVLGEVKVPLKRLQIKQVLPFMANLEPPEEVLEVENYLRPSIDLGYLDVCLHFNPLGNKLLVKIVQATGLPKIGMTGHPDVSIKAWLYCGHKRISKKSTLIKKRARDPVYNTTIEFDLSRDRFQDSDVLFEIRHHGAMYRTIIGYVTIGTSAGGEGEKHWKALLDFSNHEKRHKILSHKPVALL